MAAPPPTLSTRTGLERSTSARTSCCPTSQPCSQATTPIPGRQRPGYAPRKSTSSATDTTGDSATTNMTAEHLTTSRQKTTPTPWGNYVSQPHLDHNYMITSRLVLDATARVGRVQGGQGRDSDARGRRS